jgi:hypothetical protein
VTLLTLLIEGFGNLMLSISDPAVNGDTLAFIKSKY